MPRTQRCKNGFRRIPAKTGRCTANRTTKKRCANGTRKNRKTGNCVSYASKVLTKADIAKDLDDWLDDICSWPKDEKQEFIDDKALQERIIHNASRIHLKDEDKLMELFSDIGTSDDVLSTAANTDRYIRSEKAKREKDKKRAAKK